MICPLSRAHLAALTAYVFSLLSILVDIRLAAALLLLFVIFCILAYFLPGCGFYLPVVSRGKKKEEAVAITFNDGPSPEVTPRLLDLLALHGVTATFFVTGANAGRHPGIVKETISRGHAIGNHSFSHSPFLMLKGMADIRGEIAATQQLLKGIGVVPLVFRPPLGITGPRLWRPLLELGMFCVSFSCRDSGRGSRRTAGLAERLLKKAAPGDIILVNDVIERQENADLFLKEIAMLLDGLHGKGLRIIPLDRLIGRETMLRHETPNGSKPVELFYNDLAPTYDHEQFQTAVSMSKRKEYELFSARLPELFAGAGRVLEIGAGTGIFTIPIARHCREVIAIDISRNMLGLLEKKAAGEGVANIRTILGDVEMGPPEGTFSVICSFAAFEYMADLPGLLRTLARHLDPGGAIFFITARCSFLRFFIQLGNAMRQGVWLKAHSRSEIREMLQAAGFEQIEINSHLFRVFNYGGMLLEVVARRPADPNASVAPDEGGKECMDMIESPLTRTLLVIPVCGRSRALRHVVESAIEQGLAVLVVDAGGDDGDLAVIADLPVERLRLAAETGKGRALLAGAAYAKERGYGAILAIDVDGQHDPANARLLLDAAGTSWPAIVIGVGRKEATGMAGPSKGNNDFSAFWVRLECGQSLPDTRSGFRLYPVDFLTSRHFYARGRGFEAETLVRGAWAGLPLISVEVPQRPLPVDSKDRHAFRPSDEGIAQHSIGWVRNFTDNLNLVFLHTLLTTRSLLPWPHKRIVPKSTEENPLLLFSEPLRFFRLLCREHASAAELAAASWVGIFIGALPIIPFGIVTIVYVNHKLHLNKLAGVAASNVCVFPFVPLLCVEVGHFFRFGRFWSEFNRQTLLHEIHYRLWEWLLGSLVVGPIIGFGGALLTYILVRRLRSAP